MSKRCPKCKETKPLNLFWRNHSRGRAESWCKSCKKENLRKHRARNPMAGKIRYAANPEAEKERQLTRKYGITFKDYEHILETQEGLCAICRKPPKENRRFDVDHCHRSSVVRGLLCNSCNRMLGHAQDCPVILRSAADYMETNLEIILAQFRDSGTPH